MRRVDIDKNKRRYTITALSFFYQIIRNPFSLVVWIGIHSVAIFRGIRPVFLQTVIEGSRLPTPRRASVKFILGNFTILVLLRLYIILLIVDD